jgi:hypothetical protein
MSSTEFDYLILAPVAASILAAAIRGRSTALWWVVWPSLAFLCAVAFGVLDAPDWSFLLIAGPISAMCLVLRLDVFGRRPWLVLVAGPIVYWLGVLLTLAIAVPFGLLIP